jgi:hypothetical protein
MHATGAMHPSSGCQPVAAYSIAAHFIGSQAYPCYRTFGFLRATGSVSSANHPALPTRINSLFPNWRRARQSNAVRKVVLPERLRSKSTHQRLLAVATCIMPHSAATVQLLPASGSASPARWIVRAAHLSVSVEHRRRARINASSKRSIGFDCWTMLACFVKKPPSEWLSG